MKDKNIKKDFTPGPWKFLFGQTPETVEILGVTESKKCKGWNYKTIHIGNSNDEVLAEVKSYTTNGFLQDFNQWEANSKLIVSAPDLLEALQSALPYLHKETREKAEAAIKKATN